MTNNTKRWLAGAVGAVMAMQMFTVLVVRMAAIDAAVRTYPQSIVVQVPPDVVVAPPSNADPSLLGDGDTFLEVGAPGRRSSYQAAGSQRRISSSAYCNKGRMANGERVHDGAVASKTLPRGSRWRVEEGPLAGRVYTVKDTGSKAYFDVWMAQCGKQSTSYCRGKASTHAYCYGRRTVLITEV